MSIFYKPRRILNAWGTGAIELNKLPEMTLFDGAATSTPSPTPVQQPAQSGGNIVVDAGMKVAEKALTKNNPLSDLTSIGDYGNAFYTSPGAMTAMAQGGASQGLLYPGGISGEVPAAFSGTGNMGALGNAGAALQAMPFTLVASIVIPKLIDGFFGKKPAVSFSGADPKYVGSDGQVYNELNKPGQTGQKSQKYDYYISARDTGDDAALIQQMIAHYDNEFDKMSAQGIPVNELLARNKEFSFGSEAPAQLIEYVNNHFTPDIESYKATGTFEDRQLHMNPMGSLKGMSGREASDAGMGRTTYSGILGKDGVSVDTSNMTPLEMATNKNVTHNQKLAASGGDLDQFYAEALATPKAKNLRGGNDEAEKMKEMLRRGGRELSDFANNNDWKAQLVEDWRRSKEAPALLHDSQAKSQQAEQEPTGLLSQRRIANFNRR